MYFASAQGAACPVGGDSDIANPVGLTVPGLARLRVEKKGFGVADFGGGVEEGDDLVVGGGVEHDFVEEGGLSIAAGAAVLGALVVVECVIGGLAEVAAAEDELAEGEVEGV